MAHLRSRAFALGIFLPAFLLGTALPTLASAEKCPSLAEAKAFFKAARKVQRRGLSAENVESYNCILAYWDELQLKDKRWLAYALATAWHESRMRPLREGSGSHAKAVRTAKLMYSRRITKTPYHKKHPKTGKVYYGRGLVQLTWPRNYLAMGKAIGMGDALWRNPDLVLQPDIAAKVMLAGMKDGKFCSENNRSIIRKCTGSRKRRLRSRFDVYFNKRCSHWYRARRMINGDLRKTSNRIAGYAKTYQRGLGTIPRPAVAVSVPEVEVDKDAPVELPELSEQVTKPVLPGEQIIPDEEVVNVTPTPLDAKIEGGDEDQVLPLKPMVAPVDATISDDKVIKPVLPGEEPNDEPTIDIPQAPKDAAPSGATDALVTADKGTTGSAADNAAMLAKLQSDNSKHLAEINSLKAELARLWSTTPPGDGDDGQAKEIAILKAESSERLTEIDRLKADNSRMGVELSTLQERYDRQSKELTDSRAELRAVNDNLNAITSSLAGLTAKMDRLTPPGSGDNGGPPPNPSKTVPPPLFDESIFKEGGKMKSTTPPGDGDDAEAQSNTSPGSGDDGQSKSKTQGWFNNILSYIWKK